MLATKLPPLVERYLTNAAPFKPASAVPVPYDFTKLNLQASEQVIGIWRAAGIAEYRSILISNLGVWGYFDGTMTFVPYPEISDLRMPDPNDATDRRMHELMLYTRDGRCIFFPLLNAERNYQEAAILFRFLSSIVSLHMAATFRGTWA